MKGCAYCGGLGHRVTNCPKLEATRQKTGQQAQDFLTSGARYEAEKGYGGSSAW